MAINDVADRGVQPMLSMAQDAPWIKLGKTKKPEEGEF